MLPDTCTWECVDIYDSIFSSFLVNNDINSNKLKTKNLTDSMTNFGHFFIGRSVHHVAFILFIKLK